jgi:hypothetical protein
LDQQTGKLEHGQQEQAVFYMLTEMRLGPKVESADVSPIRSLLLCTNNQLAAEISSTLHQSLFFTHCSMVKARLWQTNFQNKSDVAPVDQLLQTKRQFLSDYRSRTDRNLIEISGGRFMVSRVCRATNCDASIGLSYKGRQMVLVSVG